MDSRRGSVQSRGGVKQVCRGYEAGQGPKLDLEDVSYVQGRTGAGGTQTFSTKLFRYGREKRLGLEKVLGHEWFWMRIELSDHESKLRDFFRVVAVGSALFGNASALFKVSRFLKACILLVRDKFVV